MKHLGWICWGGMMVCFSGLMAQEECGFEATGKVVKLLEKAADDKRYSAEERMALYQQAAELEEGCLPCWMEWGDLAFKLARQGKLDWVSARVPLQMLTAACPAYHANPWYQLGAIAYAAGEWEAAQSAFGMYLDFPADSAERLGTRYDRQAEEVRSLLDQLAFEVAFQQFAGAFAPRPLDGVNSADDEYLPALSPDGSLLFFTRKSLYKAKGDIVTQQIERFCFTERTDASESFGTVAPLPAPFNEGPHYGGASISVDNRELFIAAENPLPGFPKNIDLYQVTYEVESDGAGGWSYHWGALRRLPAPINSPEWEAQPALSADGKELFFAAIHGATTPDGSGNPTMDILRCIREPDGDWGAPEPLPAPVNSNAHDKAPFLHPDGRTLFFSSDRKPGGGGYDLWVTQRQPDGSWSAPRNLGAPVNTPGDEHGLVVSTDGKEAFFASRRPGTQGLDILSFPLPEAFRPEEMTILKGTLRRPDGTAPQAGTSLHVEFLQSGTRTQVDYRSDDGSFAQAIRLPAGEDVVLVAEGEGLGFDAVVVQQKDAPVVGGVPSLSIESRALTPKQPLEMRNIEFETNSARPDPTSTVLIAAFARYLQRNPNYRANIWGHTDNLGDPEENLRLSERRAEAVRDGLIQAGVPADRLRSKGWGASRPLESNASEAGRARNRRTECVIDVQ